MKHSDFSNFQLTKLFTVEFANNSKKITESDITSENYTTLMPSTSTLELTILFYWYYLSFLEVKCYMEQKRGRWMYTIRSSCYQQPIACKSMMKGDRNDSQVHNESGEHGYGNNRTKILVWYSHLKRMEEGRIFRTMTECEARRKRIIDFIRGYKQYGFQLTYTENRHN